MKHCASHFAVIQNGGEIDYQYGESLHAMGGRSRSFSPRKTGASAGMTREQQFEESTCNSPREMVSPAMGLETPKPSSPVDIDSVILGTAPIIQGVDNVEKDDHCYVQHEDSSGKLPSSALQNNRVEQPAGLDLVNVAACGLFDESGGLV